MYLWVIYMVINLKAKTLRKLPESALNIPGPHYFMGRFFPLSRGPDIVIVLVYMKRKLSSFLYEATIMPINSSKGSTKNSLTFWQIGH